jgi:DNA polymerase-3 subunit epsilon
LQRLRSVGPECRVDGVGHIAVTEAAVTAEVFTKLIPLLAERSIHTLVQARDAAQQTCYARLSQ